MCGQSSASATTDSGRGGTPNCDMQGVSHDQSCQDAMGRHKMMKQVSTVSIQVGEGMYNNNIIIKIFNILLQQSFLISG